MHGGPQGEGKGGPSKAFGCAQQGAECGSTFAGVRTPAELKGRLRSAFPFPGDGAFPPSIVASLVSEAERSALLLSGECS